MVAVALLVAIAEAFVAPAPSHRASVPMRVPVHRGLAPGIAAAPQLSPLTLGLQSVHAAAVCAGMAFPEQADGFAASAWRAFDACPLTHERMFEASLSVSCFVLFILGFESLHKVVDPRRWRLDGAMPKDPLHGFTRQWWKATVPAATYLGAIWLYHQLGMGELLFGLPPAEVLANGPGDPTWMRVVSEVSIGVFLYDMLFYQFHWSFHQAKLPGWRKQHARHHVWGSSEASAHNAVETVQNSFLDSGIQVFINICVQHISPWGFKHPLSRALHNMLVIYLLCESHSGYDLPFMSHRIFPGVFGGPVRHEQHHRQGNVYFHQFFTWADGPLGHTPTAAQDRKYAEAMAAVARRAEPPSERLGAEAEMVPGVGR